MYVLLLFGLVVSGVDVVDVIYKACIVLCDCRLCVSHFVCSRTNTRTHLLSHTARHMHATHNMQHTVARHGRSGPQSTTGPDRGRGRLSPVTIQYYNPAQSSPGLDRQ